jgi:LuxR family maltose regulon positive regulatory protein
MENILDFPTGARPDLNEFRPRRGGAVPQSERDYGRGSGVTALSAGERTSGEIHDILARRRPARADQSVTDMLTQLLDVSGTHPGWAAVAAFLLGTMARDTPGDPDVAGRALRHALDLVESAAFPARVPGPAPPPDKPAGHREILTHGETRVLNYLPTNLSALEIARELYLSVHTVRTYQRHLYQKLGARSRTQAVEQARALGLLPPSPRRRP